MIVVLAEYIIDTELKPLKKYFDMADIIRGCQKVMTNLGQLLKSPRNMPGCRFYKIRIGGRVKGRMIVYVYVAHGKVVPVLIRLKKDKIFGMNMALNNPFVEAELDKNIDRVLKDIENKRYQEVKL